LIPSEPHAISRNILSTNDYSRLRLFHCRFNIEDVKRPPCQLVDDL